MVELHKGDFAFLQIFTLQTDPFEGHFPSFANIDFILQGSENSSSSFMWF